MLASTHASIWRMLASIQTSLSHAFRINTSLSLSLSLSHTHTQGGDMARGGGDGRGRAPNRVARPESLLQYRMPKDLSLSLTHSHTLSLSLSLSHTHTHTHSLSLSLSRSVAISHVLAAMGVDAPRAARAVRFFTGRFTSKEEIVKAAAAVIAATSS
ncbi:hypothetical protein T484DRAFT_2876646 [Baffinella frigidus]|nr:hypothetical protein T484DRAFT_2876646 [Cryptophyta sp. CCMP2293]